MPALTTLIVQAVSNEAPIRGVAWKASFKGGSGDFVGSPGKVGRPKSAGIPDALYFVRIEANWVSNFFGFCCRGSFEDSFEGSFTGPLSWFFIRAKARGLVQGSGFRAYRVSIYDC